MILNKTKLATLRQKLYDEYVENGIPIDFDQAVANPALQKCEDAIVASSFNAEANVKKETITNTSAVAVKADLDADKITDPNLKTVLEAYLDEHPPVVNDRQIDDTAINTWVSANKGLFSLTGLSAVQKTAFIKVSTSKKVEEVV